MRQTVSSRHFVYQDGQLLKLSQKSRSDFYLKGEPCLKQFAGQTINILDVYLSMLDGKPEKIIKVYGVRHKVNERGGLDEEYDADSGDLIRYAFDKPRVVTTGPVVHAEAKFHEKKIKGKHRWEVPQEVIQTAQKAIFK